MIPGDQGGGGWGYAGVNTFEETGKNYDIRPTKHAVDIGRLREDFSELVLQRRLRRASTTIFRRMAALFARAVEACSCPREPDAPCQLCPRHWPGTSLRRRG